MDKIVVLSGGADPIHIGHLHYINNAKMLGNWVIWILNSDKWLRYKKRYVFMTYEHRKIVLESIKGIDTVYKCIDEDDTVCRTLTEIRKQHPVSEITFVKGGDRRINEIPERNTCNIFDIKMIEGVGGFDKASSSSKLVHDVVKQYVKDEMLFADLQSEIAEEENAG